MIWSAMPIRDSLVLYVAAAVFVAAILFIRYSIAPAIVHHGGTGGFLLALAALYLIALALDRQ